MFENTLEKGTKDILAALGNAGLLKDAYLAGGTGASLQLGHRVSVDLDFFTLKEFVPKAFSVELAKLGSFNEQQADKGTVIGMFKDVKFSLFIYKYALVSPALKYLALDIASLKDIAAMKIDAIATRGAKRDFYDLYFILQSGYILTELFNFYEKKYQKLASNLVHIKKSLVYFDDAEPEENPKMLKKITWEEIKKFFEAEVKKIN